MACVVAATLAGALLTIWIAVSQPWLGITLRAVDGTVHAIAVDTRGPSRSLPVPARTTNLASAGGPATLLETDDLIEEPDFFETYERAAAFMQRQTTLAAAMRGGPVTLGFEHPAGVEQNLPIVPQTGRPILDLPTPFWVQLLVGIGGVLIGGWVWALRPQDRATRLFALASVSLMISAHAAAIYSSRELAIDGGLFRALSALNHFGAISFGIAMTALFLSYPKPIATPAGLLAIPAVFFPWLAADILRIAPSPALGSQLPTALLMLAIVIAIAIQWGVTRGDPRARAALRWLGLSVVIGAGAFILTIIAPVLLRGLPPLEQAYAFVFFLLIHAGVALGLGRYRLFDLDTWAFRILFYAGALALMIALDAGLILLLHFDHGPSLGIALLAVGFGYLPLRDALWRRMVARQTMPEHELFNAVIEVAFGRSRAAREERWLDLLKRLFDPLEIAPAPIPVPEPALLRDGLELALPATADTPALILRHPFGGRSLFSSQHRQLARQLVSLMSHASENRAAYERGVAEERKRIAQDLHDDVGARLLSGLHGADLAQSQGAMRDALTDIRTIVSGLTGTRLPLADVLAELRHETRQRCQRAGVALDWEMPDTAAGTMVEYPVYKALRSTLREAVSNVLKHARASRIEVSALHQDNHIEAMIRDDGVGLPAQARTGGHGLRNLHDRVRAIGGHIAFDTGMPGTRITLTLPVSAATAEALP